MAKDSKDKREKGTWGWVTEFFKHIIDSINPFKKDEKSSAPASEAQEPAPWWESSCSSEDQGLTEGIESSDVYRQSQPCGGLWPTDEATESSDVMFSQSQLRGRPRATVSGPADLFRTPFSGRPMVPVIAVRPTAIIKKPPSDAKE